MAIGMSRTVRSGLLALLVVVVAATIPLPVAAQPNGNGVPGNATSARMEDLVAQAKPRLDGIANDFAATVDKLYERTRHAIDLRRSLPVLASLEKAAEPSASLDAAGREAREDELTLQIAQLRAYKFALIELYDLVTDEVDPRGKSLNALLGQYVDTLGPLFRKYQEEPTEGHLAAVLGAAGWNTVRGLPQFLSVLDSASAVLAGSVPLTRGALASLDKPALNDLVGSPSRHAPALFLAPMSDELRDGRFVICLGPEYLRTLQAAIDPVEQLETRLDHEYMQLATSRLIDIDSEAGAGKDTGETTDPNESEPSRITRQIERRQRYRGQLVAEFRQGALRYIRQLVAIGEPNPGKVIENLLDSPDSTRTLEPATRAELDKTIEEILADLPEEKGRSPRDVAEQLTAEIRAWEVLLSAPPPDAANTGDPGLDTILTEARNIRPFALRMQLDGKALRLKNLNEHLARESALAGVARTRVVTNVQSIMMIDDRIAELDASWGSAAWRFYLWAAARVLVILVIAWLLGRILRAVASRIVRAFIDRVTAEVGQDEPERLRDITQRAKTLSGVFLATIRIVVWVTAILMVLGQFNVDYQPILLATGGVSFAIGFGAQTVVRDFFSGFFILLENQFQIGDVVSINGISGSVEAVSLRTVRLRSVDGGLSVIPNGEIKAVTNLTHLWSRLSVNIGVGYNEDPDQVREIINRVGRDMLADPEWSSKLVEAPSVLGLDNFGASSLDFRVVAKTRPGEQWAATREFRRRIKIAFDLEGIEIPYNYVNYVTANPGKSKVLKNHTAASPSVDSGESQRQSATAAKLRAPDGDVS